MAEPQKKLKLTIGDVVADRYRIDGVVGRGGFGAVYQATQLDTGLGVALKVLLKNFSSGKKDSKRFQREAALVQQLRHPNVVALLDYGATRQGQPFIAFELLAGESLSAVLKKRGPMPLERVVQITRGVLHALYAAHTLGIIHRDIKPGNVFLCDDGDGVKVLDFGIAKAVSGEQANVTQLTEAGQMIGTPQYMAPEQVRGTGVYPATDLYALGLVMSELLTGKKVVQSPALLDVYMQHIDDRPFELPPLVRDSPLGPIVQRAVAKVLDLRYSTATEMGDDLDAAVPPPASVEPLSARTIEMPSRPGLLDPLETTAPLADGAEPALEDQWVTEMPGKPPGTVVMDRPEGLDQVDLFEAMPDSSAAETADRHSGFDPLGLAASELVGPEAQATRDSWPVYPVPGGPPAASAVPSGPDYGQPITPPGPGPESLGGDLGGPMADRPSYPMAVPSSPALDGAAPSHPGAVAHPGAGQLGAGHPGSGEYFGLHEQTYGDDDYGPDSRAHFRSGLLIVLIVFVLAAVIMALVWWAPWDDASAPAQPGDRRLAAAVASAPAPAPVGSASRNLSFLLGKYGLDAGWSQWPTRCPGFFA